MRDDYISLRYKPKINELVAEYYLEPSMGYSFEDVANAVAGESSIDTWSDIKTLKTSLANKLKPHVFSIAKNKGIIKIALRLELFELGSVAQLLSSVAGNILSMKKVRNIRLLDLHLPESYVKSFQGPKFGIAGVRRLFRIKRPLLGTIVKPKLGLSPKEHALVAYEAWIGGVDLVKDDENLTNQPLNPFKERVKQALKLRAKAEKLTGMKKAYIPNITAPDIEEMLHRAMYVKSLGGEYAMIDIITTGWTAMQSLRKVNNQLKLILHAHRCMHSAFTRNEKHGIAMLMVAKLARLIGIDQLHIGTVIGKMEGSRDEVLSLDKELTRMHIDGFELTYQLKQDWFGLKRVMPVASGGLQPLMIPKLYEFFGNDAVFQFGGGIHAHPKGTRAGAAATRQALEATLKNISLEDYAKKHSELKLAIKKWSGQRF